MLFIITAFYSEAKPLIQYLKLKQTDHKLRFPIYENTNTALIITGTGPVNAAIGTTYLLSRYSITKEDLLLNLGICGCASHGTDLSADLGELYLCNQLTNTYDHHTCYPDMLFSSNYKEAALTTIAATVETAETPDKSAEGYHTITVTAETADTPDKSAESYHTTGVQLVDMEGSGIYQAASYFLAPHQMLFAKIISDFMDTSSLTPQLTEQLITPQIPGICTFCAKIQSYLPSRNILTDEDLDVIKQVSEQLHLSVTRKIKLEQTCSYAKLIGRNLIKILRDFQYIINQGIKNKMEGAHYFEQLIRQLTQL